MILVAAVGLLQPSIPPNAPPRPAAMAVPAGRIIVEVLNGTQRQGAARTATRMLRHGKVDVVFVGNADSTADSTRVIVRRGDPAKARYVAQLLGGGMIVVQTDTLRRVDVSVILGEDFRPRLPLHP